MTLCRYNNMLGEPGKGIHSMRLGGVAIADVIMTFIGALFLSFLFQWKFIYAFISLFLLGIFLHRMFCVRTTIDKWLFPNSE